MSVVDAIVHFLTLNPYVIALTVIVTFVSVPLGMWIANRANRDPKLRCRISVSGLFREVGTGYGGVEVLVHGKQIQSLYVTRVAVWNEGRGSLRREDMVTKDQLSIVFPEGDDIVDARVFTQTSESVDATVNSLTNPGKVTLSADLLNFDEGFVVQVLHRWTKQEKIRVTGTVANCGKVDIAYDPKPVSHARRFLPTTLINRTQAWTLTFLCLSAAVALAVVGSTLLSWPRLKEIEIKRGNVSEQRDVVFQSTGTLDWLSPTAAQISRELPDGKTLAVHTTTGGSGDWILLVGTVALYFVTGVRTALVALKRRIPKELGAVMFAPVSDKALRG